MTDWKYHAAWSRAHLFEPDKKIAVCGACVVLREDAIVSTDPEAHPRCFTCSKNARRYRGIKSTYKPPPRSIYETEDPRP